MKIVQSFWSGQNDLLTHSFGWHSPVYHLMGWTLSCLRLREYYEEVELYTDSAGYDLLIGQLKLPYTKAYIALDRLNHYPADLWGLGKVTTYSLQEKPFIHVDGDVFIYKPFAADILEADLIVQNLETATGHYDMVFQEICNSLTYLPREFEYQPSINKVYSCNAGIIGGNDVQFFKDYTADVFRFIEENTIANIPSYILTNFNILFEQVLFYSKAISEGKTITTLFNKIFTDNDYHFEEIADFTKVPFRNTYLHLIGSLKRNITICELMSRTLLKEHAEYYFKLTSLIGTTIIDKPLSEAMNKAVRDSDYVLTSVVRKQLEPFESIRNRETGENSVSDKLKFLLQEALRFEATINNTIEEYKEIHINTLIKQDVQSLSDTFFVYESRENQLGTRLQKAPFVKIIQTVYNWALFTNGQRHLPLTKNIIDGESTVYIASVPACLHPYHKEIVLDELEQYVLSLLENIQTFCSLINKLETCFSKEDIQNGYEEFYQLVIMKIKYLIINKCLCIVPHHQVQDDACSIA